MPQQCLQLLNVVKDIIVPLELFNHLHVQLEHTISTLEVLQILLVQVVQPNTTVMKKEWSISIPIKDVQQDISVQEELTLLIQLITLELPIESVQEETSVLKELHLQVSVPLELSKTLTLRVVVKTALLDITVVHQDYLLQLDLAHQDICDMEIQLLILQQTE